MKLEQPIDLVRADRKEITSEELPFITVAYALWNMESFLPNPYCRPPGRGANRACGSVGSAAFAAGRLRLCRNQQEGNQLTVAKTASYRVPKTLS